MLYSYQNAEAVRGIGSSSLQQIERHEQLNSKWSVSTIKCSSKSWSAQSSSTSSGKSSSRLSRDKRSFEETIKKTELMAKAEYIERRQLLEFKTQRIKVAEEVTKLKPWVKILKAPKETLDDPQVRFSLSLKSKTSHLNHIQHRKKIKENS